MDANDNVYVNEYAGSDYSPPAELDYFGYDDGLSLFSGAGSSYLDNYSSRNYVDQLDSEVASMQARSQAIWANIDRKNAAQAVAGMVSNLGSTMAAAASGAGLMTSSGSGNAIVTIGPMTILGYDDIGLPPGPGFPATDTGPQTTNVHYSGPDIRYLDTPQNPFDAIVNAGRDTFGNAVFQQPLTTLAEAGAEQLAFVGTFYAGAEAYPFVKRGVASGVEIYNGLSPRAKAFIAYQAFRMAVSNGVSGEHTVTNLAERRLLSNTIAAETLATMAKDAAKSAGSSPHP